MKSTTVSEPLADGLPSSLGASLPCYFDSISSSGVTTKCAVIEKPDSMSIDMHDAASLPIYSDSSSSSGVTTKSDVIEQDCMSVDMHDVESSDDGDSDDDGGGGVVCIRRRRRLYEYEGIIPGSRIPKLSPEVRELMHEYINQVTESEGFDYIECPAPLIGYPDIELGSVIPGDLEDDKVMDMADLAIADFNKKNDTKYEVVELWKVNEDKVGIYDIFYITFVAEIDGDDPVPKTFQAKVGYDVLKRKTEVVFCRCEKKRDSGI